MFVSLSPLCGNRGRGKEDAHYFPTRSDIVLECSTIRAIFGRPRRWQCGQHIPLVLNVLLLINCIKLWTSHLKHSDRERHTASRFVDWQAFSPSTLHLSRQKEEKKRARRERRWYNMDEEYDVIVLGTGLTVSSQPPIVCLETTLVLTVRACKWAF